MTVRILSGSEEERKLQAVSTGTPQTPCCPVGPCCPAGPCCKPTDVIGVEFVAPKEIDPCSFFNYSFRWHSR